MMRRFFGHEMAILRLAHCHQNRLNICNGLEETFQRDAWLNSLHTGYFFMLSCRLFFFVCFFKIIFLKKNLSERPSECQTVWTLIRPNDSSGLIRVQTVCQGYKQTTLVDKELNSLPVCSNSISAAKFSLSNHIG